MSQQLTSNKTHNNWCARQLETKMHSKTKCIKLYGNTCTLTQVEKRVYKFLTNESVTYELFPYELVMYELVTYELGASVLGTYELGDLWAYAYLHHTGVLRIAVHHVIEGSEEIPQGLHEICLSFVLVQSGEGLGSQQQMIKSLLFAQTSSKQDPMPLQQLEPCVSVTFAKSSIPDDRLPRMCYLCKYQQIKIHSSSSSPVKLAFLKQSGESPKHLPAAMPKKLGKKCIQLSQQMTPLAYQNRTDKGCRSLRHTWWQVKKRVFGSNCPLVLQSVWAMIICCLAHWFHSFPFVGDKTCTASSHKAMIRKQLGKCFLPFQRTLRHKVGTNPPKMQMCFIPLTMPINLTKLVGITRKWTVLWVLQTNDLCQPLSQTTSRKLSEKWLLIEHNNPAVFSFLR